MFRYLNIQRGSTFLLVVMAVLLSGCKETLTNALTEQEATKLTYELNKRQIAAEKRAGDHGMFSVLVPSPHVNDAFSTLDKLQRFTRTTKQQEVAAPGIMSSSLETQLYVSRQLAKSLEETLLLIPGTVAVRVVVAPAPDSGAGIPTARQNVQPSASVLIVTETDEQKTSSDAIAKYVAAGLNTLQERIQVMTVSSANKEVAIPTPPVAQVSEAAPSIELLAPLPSAATSITPEPSTLLAGLLPSLGIQEYALLILVLGLITGTYHYVSRMMLVRRLQQL